MPEISVIIPYYNSSLFLFRMCIESILGQTFSDFELIAVIDGSPNDCRPVQQEFERKDPRVKFFYQENKGVSAARNLGIEKASGKYLSFVDSDDYADETFLSKLHKAVERYDLAICGIAEQHFPTARVKLDQRVFFSLPAEYCWLQYTNFSVNKLYDAEIIRNRGIRFDTGVRQGEDALFLTQYLSYCKNIASIDDRLYHYVWNGQSAMHKYHHEYWDWEKRVIEGQWKLFHRYPLSEREAEYLYFWLYTKFCGVFIYYLENDKEDGLNYVRKAVRHPLYRELLTRKLRTSEFFKKKNLFALGLWRKLGLKGIKLYYVLKRAY